MPNNREMTVEQQAKELVDTALKDHDDGGYQFASVGETIALRIAQAIHEAVSAEREACAQIADAYPQGQEPSSVFESMEYAVMKVMCPAMAASIRARGEKKC